MAALQDGHRDRKPFGLILRRIHVKIWQSALACGVLALGAVAGAHPAQAQAAQFPDVPSNHWAYQAVMDLANEGYVKGYPDGKFLGNRALTRYEFATVIDRIVQTVNDLNGKVGALQTPTGVPVTQDDLNKIQALVDNFQTELTTIQSQIGDINDQLDSLRQDVLDTKAIANKALDTANNSYGVGNRKFSISGYVQARYEAAGSSNESLYPRGTAMNIGAYNGSYATGANSQSFLIRRSRLKVSGAITNNTKYAIQLDASGATTTTAQQVTIREGNITYTFGNGNSAIYPSLEAGQFANPFGYQLPASTANTLTPERPLGFNEGGAGIWANEDYVVGVQAGYVTQQKFLFVPGGLKLSYSAVNPNGRSTDNTTRHVDSIYRIGYTLPSKILGLGASYYDGEVSNGAFSVTPAANTFREPKKQLFGFDGQFQLPVGLFVNGEYEQGIYETRSYLVANAAGSYTFDTDNYVKNNHIAAYYVQGGWTFGQHGSHPLTVAVNYDALYRSHSAQSNGGDILATQNAANVLSGASYDDTNLGYGILYNLDKATRVRVWYNQPFQVAHGANTPVPQRIGLFTTELQVKF
jgi:hypothetical protein